MFKSKNFWIGIVIALMTVTFYKTVALNNKASESLPQENLTLWDLDYVPSHPPKTLDDFDLLLIKTQDSADAQPTVTKFSTFKGQPVILHFWATWCVLVCLNCPAMINSLKLPTLSILLFVLIKRLHQACANFASPRISTI